MNGMHPHSFYSSSVMANGTNIKYETQIYDGYCVTFWLFVFLAAPKVHQLEGNTCEITWETIPPMRGDPLSYVLQVLVGRESEYKQVCVSQTYVDTFTHTHTPIHRLYEDSVRS